MSKTFKYIQNEDVLKTFTELKNTTLAERSLVIARHGDYSLLLERCGDDALGLKILNTGKDKVVSERVYYVSKTTNELVSRGVRHACQKMSEMSDEDVNRKRFQIWKWYLLDWQKKHSDETQNILDKEIEWNEESMKKEADLMDMELFLHGEYLNLGNTLNLIDLYLHDDNHKEMFKKFAIADIMEMTSEDTKEKAMEEAEKKRDQEGEIKYHTYKFSVSVEATDKEHARQALLNYLAGDPRIRIQK